MTTYHHTQRAPLCLLGFTLLTLGVVLQNEPPIRLIFPVVGVLTLVLAASFHHLTVNDQGDKLSISFGPIPLFHRDVKYEDIISAEVGRTTILDGWGIHLSLRGGWVWNVWGRDCVVVRFKRGTLYVGTDDAEKLARFISGRIVRKSGI